MRRNGQLRVLLLVLCLLPASDLAQGFGRAKGLVAPLFLGNKSRPSAVIKIQSLAPGHQRMGFFRIGLLPEIEADNVSLEVIERGDLLPMLQETQEYCARLAKAPLAIRNFNLRFRGEGKPVIESKSLSFSVSGDWRLANGRLVINGREFFFKNAILRTTGEGAGKVDLGSATHRVSIL